MPDVEDSLSNGPGAGGLRSVGAQAECMDLQCELKGLYPGPRAQGPVASSVPDTSVVPSSGHVLHGDSKARRKCLCRQQIPEPWAQGALGQV